MENLRILARCPLALLLSSCALTAHIADDAGAGTAGDGPGSGGADSPASGGKHPSTGGAAANHDNGGERAVAPSGGTTQSGAGAGSGGVGGDAGAPFGGTTQSTGGASSAGAAGEAGAPSSQPSTLCDGEDHLRFAATAAAGNETGVPAVTQEAGYSYLLIDGYCRYWVMDAWEHETRSGTLTDEQAAQFTADLRPDTWERQTSTPQECLDGGTTSLRFVDAELRFHCGDEHNVLPALTKWEEELYDSGTALDGDVRYSVHLGGATSGWPRSDYADDAATWPLAGDPATVSSESPEGAIPQTATGEDAALLRQLRANYLRAPMPVPEAPWLSIPVLFEGGDSTAYYDVAVRDVVPFELDGRLDPDAFF